jgi:hypothetical protein
MQPRGELSSTGYVLANPANEYLVLDPGQKPGEAAGRFTVALEAGEYTVEWHSVTTRETREAANLVVENAGSTGFTAPFAEAGPAVLYLNRTGRQ